MMDERDRDPAADDLFVDHCLHQELGGRRPPDLAARIAAAPEAHFAAAAAKVDRAAAAAAPRPWARIAGLLAAILVGSVALWFAFAGAAPRLRSVDELGLQLIDDFHRAMPSHPVLLRDERQRTAAAPQALPVLRAIRAHHAANPGETLFGTRIVEFEVYALELGDAALREELQQRAAAGDRGAAAALATAQLATGDGEARTAALAELGGHLQARPDLAASLVRVLGTADLTREEARRIGEALADAGLRRDLQREVELAANGPRRLLGQRLELFGRLLDDRLFSTATLRGKVVLVCYWASWCRPCLDVLAEIRRIQARHAELEVVAVSCDHDYAALRAGLDAHHDPRWIQFFDRRRPGWHEFALAQGIGVVPFLLLLDREGIVREVDPRANLESAVQQQLAR